MVYSFSTKGDVDDKEFPLILLQAKAVRSLMIRFKDGSTSYTVSINSPSGEGGE